MKTYKVVFQDIDENDLYTKTIVAPDFESAFTSAYDRMGNTSDDSRIIVVTEIEINEEVERNEFGDEFVGGCATCGEDTNSSDINGNCKNCK